MITIQACVLAELRAQQSQCSRSRRACVCRDPRRDWAHLLRASLQLVAVRCGLSLYRRYTSTSAVPLVFCGVATPRTQRSGRRCAASWSHLPAPRLVPLPHPSEGSSARRP